MLVGHEVDSNLSAARFGAFKTVFDGQSDGTLVMRPRESYLTLHGATAFVQRKGGSERGGETPCLTVQDQYAGANQGTPSAPQRPEASSLQAVRQSLPPQPGRQLVERTRGNNFCSLSGLNWNNLPPRPDDGGGQRLSTVSYR